jgi:F-type H+-transporting ATPase subunit delta
MAAPKQVRQTARVLFSVSLENGAVSPERVAGVLAWFEKTNPPRGLALLREYHRLVRIEINRTRARIEHAGALSDDSVAAIATFLSKRYGRSISATAVERPDLIAGIRVSIGDDVFESSIAGQLESLSIAS